MRAVVDGQTRAVLGEGPIWHTESQSLLWIDITAGLLHRTTGEGTQSRELGAPAGSVVPRAAGGVVIAFADRIVIEDAERQPVLTIDTRELAPRHRFNDGACDSRGRYWTGTIATEFGSEPGLLLRLDPDGELRVMRENVAFSNGIGWSPDDGTMYLIDSLGWVLLAFPFDAQSGELGAARRVVTFAESGGLPDGLAVDADGRIWVARYGAGALECYSSGGLLEHRIMLPATQPTSPAFGGPDLSTLWVTTARQYLDAPNAADGALLRIDTGATGLRSWSFGG